MAMTDDFRYTVMMSVYSRVDCGELKTAVDSMLAQTLPPAEFVIVKDGPLTPELDAVIDGYCKEYPQLFKICPLSENQGLGVAYAEGTKLCGCEYIAIMDSDDYSLPERCMTEAEYFSAHPETGIVGSSIMEFIGTPDNFVSYRKMPETHDECVKFAHSRCPSAHPSTMLRKSALLKAGGYRSCHFAEDYDLYVRMLMAGCRFYNFKKPLVYMRVSEDFYGRRGGASYLKKIAHCKINFYKMGFYSLYDLIKGLVVHTAVCLMPNGVRSFIYKKLLRRNKKEISS